MYSYIVVLEGQETEFISDVKIDAFLNAEIYVCKILKQRLQRKPETYIKYKFYDNLDMYSDEIKAYKKLEGLGICPSLISHGVVSECKIFHEGVGKDYYFYYIETELYGVSLAKVYGGPYEMCLESREIEDDFDTYFPCPNHVKVEIRSLVERMHQAGVYHGDFHAYNLLIKDDVVKVIDFELCEFED